MPDKHTAEYMRLCLEMADGQPPVKVRSDTLLRDIIASVDDETLGDAEFRSGVRRMLLRLECGNG
jgi:hypothetical protein